ncbi:hypothetical protein CDL12_10699 [Handroanthus impetiginosus]|uniref:Uncharacterized protein n=1 Tax=Handroanthus impetiginosus TaxID=429701 RepID=A0A2G9HGU3_9LAMI|nr:hypothetical protein CDL12_10699 [Handroanthus impetiginosus]
MDWRTKIRILIWLVAFLFRNTVCMCLYACLLWVRQECPRRRFRAPRRRSLVSKMPDQSNHLTEIVEFSDKACTSNLRMDRQALSSSSSNSVTQPKSSTSSKRKSYETSTSDIELLMVKWMESTSSVLSDLADKLTQSPPPQTVMPDPDSSARTGLYGALAEIPELSLDDLVIATHHLANNKVDMDIFWGMHKEARARFVQLLLNGRLQS